MKEIILSAILLGATVTTVLAQDEKDEANKGFKKENLFTGGSITASFYTGGTILGVNPVFGYKLSNWVDAGIALNYTYQGARDIYVLDDKLRQNVYGPGAFARLYPVRFLFLQAQFEHNFTSEKYIDDQGNVSKSKADANSLLLGGGIAEGRRPGSNTFFYISLLVDVLKNQNSPYVNNVYEGNQLIRTDMVPILRAGVNIGLFQGKNNQNNDTERESGHKRPRNYNNL